MLELKALKQFDGLEMEFKDGYQLVLAPPPSVGSSFRGIKDSSRLTFIDHDSSHFLSMREH